MGKYKTGDYIVSSGFTYSRILGVIEQPEATVYATIGPKKPEHINWFTQYELDQRGYSKKTPPIDDFRKLQPGDIISVDLEANKKAYVTILARIGDVVLLSSVPNDKEKFLLDIDKFFEKELGRGLLDEEERRDMRRERSPHTLLQTADTWWHIDRLALMNWDIIPGEE